VTLALWQHCAAFALVLADVLFRARRTQLFLPVPFTRALAVNTCGDAVSAVTPGRIGGDPVRYLAYRRTLASGPAIVSAFGMEVAADAVALIAIALVLSLLFRSAEREFAQSAARLWHARDAWLVAGVTILLGAASVLWTRRFLPRAFLSARASLGEAWRHAQSQRPATLARALAWTLAGFLVRGAVLPVLLARTPGLSLGAVLLGSAVLVYGQQLAPTPGGIGAVELGAVVGFGGRIAPGSLALLVVVWRTYTLALGALAGALLLVRERGPALTPNPSTPAPFRAAS
jgi:uncharacterized membrane protein YbhN (UPF0104 family)